MEKNALAVGGDKAKQFMDLLIDFLKAYGGRVFAAILIMVIGVVVGRWLGKMLARTLEKKQLEPPVRMLIIRIIKLIILAFALVIAVQNLGVEIMPLVAGIGVAGVGIGLAMQGVLSNIVAGLTIIFTKPFRVGEYIEMLGVNGQVDTIELFSTTLIHPDRSRVIIPNRKIVGEILHNYGTIRQLDLYVGVAYDTNLTDTFAIIRQVLKDNSRVLKELAPGVGVSMLADSSIHIAIKPWVAASDYGAAQAEINLAVIEKFRAHGIEIPLPQREIRLLNGEVPAQVAPK